MPLNEPWVARRGCAPRFADFLALLLSCFASLPAPNAPGAPLLRLRESCWLVCFNLVRRGSAAGFPPSAVELLCSGYKSCRLLRWKQTKPNILLPPHPVPARRREPDHVCAVPRQSPKLSWRVPYELPAKHRPHARLALAGGVRGGDNVLTWYSNPQSPLLGSCSGQQLLRFGEERGNVEDNFRRFCSFCFCWQREGTEWSLSPHRRPFRCPRAQGLPAGWEQPRQPRGSTKSVRQPLGRALLRPDEPSSCILFSTAGARQESDAGFCGW